MFRGNFQVEVTLQAWEGLEVHTDWTLVTMWPRYHSGRKTMYQNMSDKLPGKWLRKPLKTGNKNEN